MEVRVKLLLAKLLQSLLYAPESVALQTNPKRTDVGLLYWLDNVSCNGTESKLSECEPQNVGVHSHCKVTSEEAGALCSRMFVFD